MAINNSIIENLKVSHSCFIWENSPDGIEKVGESGDMVGGIVAEANGYSEISGCHFHGNIEGSVVGGIVGESGKSIKIYNCVSEGVITSTMAGSVGGILGCCKQFEANVEIQNCYNYASVFGGFSVGGIMGMGWQNFKIADCTNAGKIFGKDTQTGNSLGGIVGHNSVKRGLDFGNDTIENCINKGEVNGSSACGGIIGQCRRTSIIKCTNSGKISASYREAGGIVGYGTDNTDIKYCYNTGNVYGDNKAGGICGRIANDYAGGNIYLLYSYNRGNISGTDMVGGLVGDFYENMYYIGSEPEKVLSDCYNSGEVKGNTNTAGIIGECKIYETGKYPAIQNCYNVGEVKDTSGNLKNARVGAFDRVVSEFSHNISKAIKNCYYSDATVNLSGLKGTDREGVKALYSGAMRYFRYFVGFDFDKIWGMGDNNYPYPVLRCFGMNMSGVAHVNPEIDEQYVNPKKNTNAIGTRGLWAEIELINDITLGNKGCVYIKDYETDKVLDSVLYNFSDNIIISGKTLKVFFDSVPYNKKVYITIDDGFIKVKDIDFHGIHDKTKWCFTTMPEGHTIDTGYFYPSAVRMNYSNHDKNLPGIPSNINKINEYKKELKAWADEFGYGDVFTEYNIDRLLEGDLQNVIGSVYPGDNDKLYSIYEGTVIEQMRDIIFLSSMKNSTINWNEKYVKIKMEDKVANYKDLVEVFNRVVKIMDEFIKYQNERDKSPIFAEGNNAYNWCTYKQYKGIEKASGIINDTNSYMNGSALYKILINNSELGGEDREILVNLLDYSSGIAHAFGAYKKPYEYMGVLGKTYDNIVPHLEIILQIAEIYYSNNKMMSFLEFCCSSLTMFLPKPLKELFMPISSVLDGLKNNKANVFFMHYYLSQDSDYLNRYFDITKNGDYVINIVKTAQDSQWKDYTKNVEMRNAVQSIIDQAANMGGTIAVSSEESKAIVYYVQIMKAMEDFDSKRVRFEFVSYLNDVLRDEENRYYVKMKVECPVDVEILNNSDKLIASFENGNIINNSNGKLAVTYEGENKDKKVVLFPKDMKSNIKLKGTGDGSMKLSLIEYDSSGYQQKAMIFNNVPLSTITKIDMALGIVDGKVDETTLLKVNNGNKTEDMKPDVLDALAKNHIEITDVVFENDIVELEIGDVFKPNVAITPFDADRAELFWHSDNKDIVEIDKFGTILAKNAGETKISVATKNGDIKKSCNVKVNSSPLNIVLDRKFVEVKVNDSFKIAATLKPMDAKGKILWKSSDETIAVVDKIGNVKACKEGQVTIVATTDNGKNGVCEVTVIDSPKDKNQNLFVPDMPKIDKVTFNSISVYKMEGQEYAISAEGSTTYGNWQDSGMFDNLESNKSYWIVTRFKETDEAYASAISKPLYVSTEMNDGDNSIDGGNNVDNVSNDTGDGDNSTDNGAGDGDNNISNGDKNVGIGDNSTSNIDNDIDNSGNGDNTIGNGGHSLYGGGYSTEDGDKNTGNGNHSAGNDDYSTVMERDKTSNANTEHNGAILIGGFIIILIILVGVELYEKRHNKQKSDKGK